MKYRLDKYLCLTLQITRQEAKTYLKRKLVKVDGMITSKPETKVDPDVQLVTFQDEELYYEPFVYYMLNKPADVVSATRDNFHKTVIDLIDDSIHSDIFPVGRLDIDTEGLLLITNDGQLGHDLTSPSKHVDKRYYVKVNGLLTADHVELFSKGLDIGDEKPTKAAILEILSATNAESLCYITISEGRFHQVKRMFQVFNLDVLYLKRMQMGSLLLDETLKLGQYRKLTQEELDGLKH